MSFRAKELRDIYATFVHSTQNSSDMTGETWWGARIPAKAVRACMLLRACKREVYH